MGANIFAAVVGIEDNEQVTSHALHTFMRHLRKKWPEMVIRDRFSTGTHASLHTAPIFKLWFTLPERVPCPIRWIVSQWTSSYFLQWKNDPGRPQEDLGKGSSGPSTKTTSGSDLRYAKRAFISAVPMLKKKFENTFLFFKAIMHFLLPVWFSHTPYHHSLYSTLFCNGECPCNRSHTCIQSVWQHHLCVKSYCTCFSAPNCILYSTYILYSHNHEIFLHYKETIFGNVFVLTVSGYKPIPLPLIVL